MEAIIKDGITAVIISKDEKINTPQDMLDIMATAGYEYQTSRLLIHKESLGETFFDLKTGVAGEILQKFSNYRMKAAIIGDFSQYQSKSLHAFIYECNRGHQIFFKSSVEEGMAALISN